MPKLTALRPLVALLGGIWCCSIIGFVWSDLIHSCALLPRNVWRLHGVISMPLVHKDWSHLLANSLPLAVFGALLMVQGRAYFYTAIVGVVVLGGLGLWLIGRTGAHIGASGLVFGLFGLLVARAYYTRSARSVAIAGLVMLGYGGLVWGVLPTNNGVSWEAHLTGAIAGVVMAKWLARTQRVHRGAG